MAENTVQKVTAEIAKAVGGRYKKVEKVVVDGYKKIEESVVGGYIKIEEGAVGGFTEMSDKFVSKFLTRSGETVEDAKARLAAEQQAREEASKVAVKHAPPRREARSDPHKL